MTLDNLRKAFYKTLPIMLGLFFMSIAYGLLLAQHGYHPIYSIAIPLLVFSGSIQFVMIDFFQAHTTLIHIALTTFLINSRHVFYGISFVQPFKAMGRSYLYMIFSLCDETYALLCANDPKASHGEVFFIALLNHLYCISGVLLGNVLGNQLALTVKGVEFSLGAMFIVTLLNNWKKTENQVPITIGMLCGLICLLLFGSANLILPGILASATLLLLLQNKETALQPQQVTL